MVRWIAWLKRRAGKGDRGSTMVLVALAMTVIFGSAAIALDAGRLYVVRQQLEDIADSAALAGAQFLPWNPDQARQTALEYAKKNGLDSTDVTVTVSDDANRLKVVARETVEFTFARILGFERQETWAAGTALSGPLGKVTGAAPLGISWDNFVFGESYYLKYSPDTREGNTPGNFRALAFGGQGADTYEENLRSGYSGALRIGDWVQTKPGNMAGPTRRAIDERLGADTTSTYLDFSPGSPRLLLVPILESFDVQGRDEVKIIGFATFFLEDVQQDGNDASIKGRFIRLVTQGEIDVTGSDFGTRVVKLIE